MSLRANFGRTLERHIPHKRKVRRISGMEVISVNYLPGAVIDDLIRCVADFIGKDDPLQIRENEMGSVDVHVRAERVAIRNQLKRELRAQLRKGLR